MNETLVDKQVYDKWEIEYQKGVLIDQCPQCYGVWLDKGELEMVSINVDAFCDEVENIALELRNSKS